LDEKTLQLNTFKKSILEKDNAIKQLMHQLTDTSKKDHLKDSSTEKKDALSLVQKD
jgi:hypothetical protein